MSALPSAGPRFAANFAMLALELLVVAAIVFVGMHSGEYFHSVTLGMIAAGVTFLVGVAFWSAGRSGSPRRR